MVDFVKFDCIASAIESFIVIIYTYLLGNLVDVEYLVEYLAFFLTWTYLSSHLFSNVHAIDSKILLPNLEVERSVGWWRAKYIATVMTDRKESSEAIPFTRIEGKGGDGQIYTSIL